MHAPLIVPSSTIVGQKHLTLADIDLALENNHIISPVRRRDQRSAIRRVRSSTRSRSICPPSAGGWQCAYLRLPV
jgi:hypothetical protein